MVERGPASDTTGICHPRKQHLGGMPDGAGLVSGIPPGCCVLSMVIRWCRSFVAQPPANICHASGMKNRFADSAKTARNRVHCAWLLVCRLVDWLVSVQVEGKKQVPEPFGLLQCPSSMTRAFSPHGVSPIYTQPWQAGLL